MGGGFWCGGGNEKVGGLRDLNNCIILYRKMAIIKADRKGAGVREEIVNYWRINTDSGESETFRTCDLWYKSKRAFTGDYAQNIRKHAKVFMKLAIGDGLFMHHSGLGIVGYGVVTETWDQAIYQGIDKLLYVGGECDEVYEYRIKVDWDAHYDCRENPLPIRGRLPYLGTYSHVDTRKWDVPSVLRDLMNRNLHS